MLGILCISSHNSRLVDNIRNKIGSCKILKEIYEKIFDGACNCFFHVGSICIGTVSAAPLASGTATLVGVDYIPGKSPVFTFSVNGHFSNSELNGSLHVEGGRDFALHCLQIDANTVKCTAPKKAAGKPANARDIRSMFGKR